MTEKRFSVGYFDDPVDIDSYVECDGEYLNATDVVKLLNELLKENEQLKQAYQTLKSRHSLLHDECLEAECDRDSLKKDVISLEKENEKLKQENKELNDIIDTIEKDYENRYGMSIRNAEWFTAW